VTKFLLINLLVVLAACSASNVRCQKCEDEDIAQMREIDRRHDSLIKHGKITQTGFIIIGKKDTVYTYSVAGW
jgi:hypothetical protein